MKKLRNFCCYVNKLLETAILAINNIKILRYDGWKVFLLNRALWKTRFNCEWGSGVGKSRKNKVRKLGNSLRNVLSRNWTISYETRVQRLCKVSYKNEFMLQFCSLDGPVIGLFIVLFTWYLKQRNKKSQETLKKLQLWNSLKP